MARSTRTTSFAASMCSMCPASTRSPVPSGAEQDAVGPAPDHGDGHVDALQQRPGVDRLPVAVEQRAEQGGQGLVDPVEPLVAQQVVHELPGHLRRVGEQLPQQRFELAPRVRRREPAQVAGVGLGGVPGRGEQRQRRHLPRFRLRHRRDHGPAERVPDQMGPLDPQGVEEPEDRVGQRRQR